MRLPHPQGMSTSAVEPPLTKRAASLLLDLSGAVGVNGWGLFLGLKAWGPFIDCSIGHLEPSMKALSMIKQGQPRAMV